MKVNQEPAILITQSCDYGYTKYGTEFLIERFSVIHTIVYTMMKLTRLYKCKFVLQLYQCRLLI